MYSKIFLIFLIAIFTSCSLSTKEKEMPKNQLALNGCLADSGKLLENYFSGKSKPEEISYLGDCLESSLVMFSQHTTGKNREYYTPRELANFLEFYFFKNIAIPANLIQEAMVLKNALIGGGTEKITKEEITKTIRLMRVFQQVAMGVRKLFPLSKFGETRAKVSDAEFDAEMKQIKVTAMNLAGALTNNLNDYSFEHLATFVDELNTYLYGKDKNRSSLLDNSSKILTYLNISKPVLFSNQNANFNNADWNLFLRFLPRVSILTLHTIRFLENSDKFYLGYRVERSSKIASHFFSLLKDIIDTKPDQRIAFQTVDDVFIKLAQKKLLPIPEHVVANYLNPLLKKLIAGDANPESGITAASVDKFYSYIQFWAEGASVINQSYALAQNNNDSHLTLLEKMKLPSDQLTVFGCLS